MLAKQALIGRAATDANRPGSLPCPDRDGDGIADLFAGSNCPAYIGRLPWKTLDLPEFRDGYGETLWYALSPGLRDQLLAQPINGQKPLELRYDGQANIAAIVFSPGPPQAGQSGRPSIVVGDYLDGSNQDGDFDYVSGPLSATFNDQSAGRLARRAISYRQSDAVLAEIRGPDNNPPAAATYGLRHYLSVSTELPLPMADGRRSTPTLADARQSSGHLPTLTLG